MYCSKCGAKIMDGTLFCTQCGASLQNYPPVQEKAGCEAEENMRQEYCTAPGQVAEKTANWNPEFYGAQGGQNAGQEPKPYEQPQPQFPSQSQIQQPMPYGLGNPAYSPYPIPIKNYDPSKDYTPISMWGYFGYQLLFAIPLIGQILILIFAFGGTKNINLRNYARSTFCLFIVLVAVVLLIMLIVAFVSASI